MFTHYNLQNVLLIFVAVCVPCVMVLHWMIARKGLSPDNLLKVFGIHVVAIGSFLVLLYWFLPDTSGLKTFGYPEEPQAVGSTKAILEYLQSYNVALVRTIEILRYFLFVFTWWFLSLLFYSLKAVTASYNKQEKDPVGEGSTGGE